MQILCMKQKCQEGSVETKEEHNARGKIYYTKNKDKINQKHKTLSNGGD